MNRSATLFKKSLWHRCYPVNFAKFLRTLFLQKTSGRLLLRFQEPYNAYKTSLQKERLIWNPSEHLPWSFHVNIVNRLLFSQYKLHHRCSTGLYMGLWNFQSEAKLEQIVLIYVAPRMIANPFVLNFDLLMFLMAKHNRDRPAFGIFVKK